MSRNHLVSRGMTKPTKWVCAQRRLSSAWASAQSDQSFRCPHEESLGLKLPIKRISKTLVRLGGCSGWSESSLGAESLCLFCHVAAQLSYDMSRNHHVYVATKTMYVSKTVKDAIQNGFNKKIWSMLDDHPRFIQGHFYYLLWELKWSDFAFHVL